ncbi:hypothetical protein WN51_01719 [Melipona quadrifasciata]|uniref:Uncharacterized protein n=1 Tax=Melipona quadrifasciata TaxID=166423 RepID=A0A0M8ZUK6_9HYME|nr:hypothetical protein WN51_01719 [Melipona quadrifasciata]
MLRCVIREENSDVFSISELDATAETGDGSPQSNKRGINWKVSANRSDFFVQ